MMPSRKPKAETVRAALRGFDTWRAKLSPRVAAVPCEVGRERLRRSLDALREKIGAGDLGVCTQAAARSIVRTLESWETGYYLESVGGPDNGGYRTI